MRGVTILNNTFLGGSVAENVHGVAVGSDGAAYVAGQTNSWQNFPTKC
jgi:hypothetical protein